MERSCGLAVFEAFHPPAKGLLPPKLRDASKRWVQLFSCTFFFVEEDVLNKKHVAVSSHAIRTTKATRFSAAQNRLIAGAGLLYFSFRVEEIEQSLSVG